MTELHPAKRLDVIVDQPLVPRIADAFRSAGITGWSVTRLLSGHGRDGDWADERLTAAETKVLVFAVASADAAGRAVDTLAPLLDSHRLLLTLADVQTVRPARFG